MTEHTGGSPSASPAIAKSFVQARWLQTLARTRHCFSSRHGGVSSGSYKSLNLAAHLSDDAAAVQENRRRLLALLGRPLASWTQANQVHGSDVREVSSRAPAPGPADALFTQDPSITLAILVADCVPIILADAGGRVVAAIHAGWRGTASNIVGRAVEACCSVAGVQPESLHAALGPAIGPCCFKIGEEVAQTLVRGRPAAGHSGEAIAERDGVWYADLWQLNSEHLGAARVAPARIEALRLCTFCGDDFFSYRRDGKLTGRQVALVGLEGRTAGAG